MIVQDPDRSGAVLQALAELLSDPTVRRLRVAVAYANLAGVRTFKEVLAAAAPQVELELVLTLDMGITRKAALQELLDTFGDSASVITTSGPGTFHAKAFVADREQASPCALVGSANLTFPALTTNREIAVISELSAAEEAEWEAWWADLTAEADGLTQEIIDDYRERRPPPGRRERIADTEIETADDGSTAADDDLDLDAAEAGWLVIDWGGTGGYRVQAELPNAAAAFFGPSAHTEEGVDITIRYEGHNYEDNQARHYPNNDQVRINLDAEIPAVADESITSGTALFTRIGADHYELELLGTTERAQRLAEAGGAGSTGHTRKMDGSFRRFGWGQ